MDTLRERQQLESVSTLGLMIVFVLLGPAVVIGGLQAVGLAGHWLGQAVQYAIMPAAFVGVAAWRLGYWNSPALDGSHAGEPMALSRTVVMGVLFGCFIVVSNSVLATASWQLVGAFIGAENAQQMMQAEQNRLLQLLVAQQSLAWRIYFGAIVIVVTPIAEELFFRGYLYHVLRSHWGVPAAAVTSAAVFSLFHFYVIQALPLFVAGLLLTLLYERTGTLRGPMVAHGVTNALVLTLFWVTSM